MRRCATGGPLHACGRKARAKKALGRGSDDRAAAGDAQNDVTACVGRLASWRSPLLMLLSMLSKAAAADRVRPAERARREFPVGGRCGRVGSSRDGAPSGS